MTETTDNELQLLCLVRHGDSAAMRTIYTTYVRYLTAVCSRYVTDDEDMKDVLQESFLKIFASIGSFEYRGRGSLKGWITKVTVNEALKFIRRNNRIEFVDIASYTEPQPDEEPDIDSVPSSVIYNMIRELPDGYRTIFNLHVIENKSHKEIASLLGIKESTSASQFHRAKSLLASKINLYNNLKSVEL